MIDSISKLTETLEASLLQPNDNANVDKSERVLSLITGAYVFTKGIANLFSHPMLALSEAAIGGLLLHRGVTGHCYVKAMSEPPQSFHETYVFTDMRQPQEEMKQEPARNWSSPQTQESQSQSAGNPLRSQGEGQQSSSNQSIE
jgi:hypothetical protein